MKLPLETTDAVVVSENAMHPKLGFVDSLKVCSSETALSNPLILHSYKTSVNETKSNHVCMFPLTRRYVKTGVARIIGNEKGRAAVGLHADGSQFKIRLSLMEIECDGERQFAGKVHYLSQDIFFSIIISKLLLCRIYLQYFNENAILTLIPV